MTYTGKCLCGATSFVAKGEPDGPHACHCEMCRRWNGGPFFGVTFSGGADIEGPVSWYASSDWAERGFCSACGAAMFYQFRDGSHFNSALGFLDDPDRFGPLKMHIFYDEKLAACAFADNAPKLTAAETIKMFSGEA
ncbi:MAG: GFA family protein [Pseudomonadota bacterium]